ncbi:hypothetical protein WG909_05035 [Peptostreptococcaceae bacterium AGR-M142]
MENKKSFKINTKGSKPITKAERIARAKNCTRPGGFLWGSRGTQYGCKC